MPSRRIYFCGSIRGGRQDRELYERLIKDLKQYGEVLTEHIADKGILEKEQLDDKGIHDRDMDWLISSDVIVAEVTQPSLGVGYEIGRAVSLNKKILCLFRPNSDKRLSAMVAGAVNVTNNVVVEKYEESQVSEIFRKFFS
ncbi:putative 2'-deoxynucleoside 5'-phosphate N-hydrolase 1 [Anneissia japonica]|uniref:putative 2'-deoxynucleoside 5'-phosphate N-hydrolase 1 n=1 Tax=Anneissia japonica TaxID=1529436 RepID=UPI001425AD64|nr:putative 2'-deoxynucleoside 5'-phosphate N-hydrolase 1 [Anneissia japonica]XP_033115805.1 putative 2'-deoxynucleoside 5'-phosphate N-hydrolase 1 [Anneissia japonica]